MHHFQFLLRFLVQLFRAHHEISVAARFAATHATAQLVELRQAKHFRLVDNHGVGASNINAGLDDGGGKQYVDFAVVEVIHDFVELGGRHLAVGVGDFYFGQ